MKRLILVRHGKAEPSRGQDFNRNLVAVGEERTRDVAHQLNMLNIVPECILSSSSFRTKQTSECMAEIFWNDREKITLLPELYLAEAGTLVNVIKQTEDVSCLMLVGHNNGISDLCTLLSRAGTYSLKTSGTIVFDIPIEHWNELTFHQAEPIWNYRLDMY